MLAPSGEANWRRSDALEQLTGVRLAEWAALGALAAGLALVLQASWLVRRGGASSGSLLGLASGAVVLVIVLGRDLDGLARLPGALVARPAAVVVAGATIAVALALVDVAFLRGRRVLDWLLGRAGVPTGPRADAAIALLSLGIVVVVLVGLVRLDRPNPTSGSTNGGVPGAASSEPPGPGATGDGGTGQSGLLASVRTFDLPGKAMAIAMRGDRDGYVSLDSGQILAFTLPSNTGSAIQLKTVLEGLDHPRGIAIRQGRLYVVERGPLPCAPDVEFCDASDINPNDGVAGEVAIMSTARAKVSAYDIGPDGQLGSASEVISGLPVSDALHTANDLTVGPDGLLYLAVGNVDYLFKAPDRAKGITPHPEWLGTILRFDGSGATPEVFARGLRNVYQVAFDDQDRMWAVDNDGPTIDGWRGEELLQIKQGRNYGFPYQGTFGPRSVRDDAALWISRHKGNAGAAWAGAVGLGQGLLAGSGGALSLLSPGEAEDIWPDKALSEWFEQDLLEVPGSLTSIQVVSAHEVVASLYGSNSGALYDIRFR